MDESYTTPGLVNGIVDIHSHLLPGVDDGPPDLEGALEMARAAYEAGVAVIAATPHLRSDFPRVHVDQIGERCRLLRVAVKAEGIPLRIVSGSEASLIWAVEASPEAFMQATYRQAGEDLLVETPSDVSMLEELLYRVRLRGVRVTLAHPERSRVFQREPHRLVALREQGVLFQVNADTLLAGRSVARRLVEHLCRNGMAQALASDGHRASGRRPVTALPTAVHVLGELVGGERALWMARDVPAAIIDGRPLPPAPEISTPRWRFSTRIRRGRPAH